MTARKILSLAFSLGVFSCMSQLVLVREVMSAFGGNELVLVFLLAGWLGGVAAGASGMFRFLHDRAQKAPGLLGAAGILLLFLFCSIRLTRVWLGIPPGEIMDAVQTGWLSALSVLPLSVLYGAVFTALTRESKNSIGQGAGRLYAIEALGFVLGGILLSGLLWLSADPFFILALLAASHWILSAWVCAHRGRAVMLAGILILFLAGGGAGRAREYLLAAEWPQFFVLASEDSLLGRVTVVQREEQVSLFENGILSYSSGDQRSAEDSVHYALLSHRGPKRVLLVSGGPDAIWEALRHPGVRVDYVEMDPLSLRLARRFFSGAEAVLGDPRVQIYSGDGRRIVKAARDRYDAILVNVADPVTLLLNRYYTQEFFEEALRAMKEGGVLSVSVSSSENYVNRENQKLLQLTSSTLRRVFSDVHFVPGGRVIFLASSFGQGLVLDEDELSRRLNERGLKTQYVQPYYFSDRLSPRRREQMAGLLQDVRQVNTDARPRGLVAALVFFSTHFNSGFAGLMEFFGDPRTSGVLVGAVLIILAALSRAAFGGIAVVSVLALGFSQIVAQSVLLLYFQSVYGYLFGWMGLLTSAFMAGVFLGGWARVDPLRAAQDLMRAQFSAGAVFFLLALVPSFSLRDIPQAAGMGCFLFVMMIVGFLGGRIFSLAASIGGTGRGLYAFDLLGSSFGALWGGAVLIPVFGVQAGLGVCSGLCLVSAVLGAIRPGARLTGKNGPP